MITVLGIGQVYCLWPFSPHRMHTLLVYRDFRSSGEIPLRSFSFSSFSASVRLSRSFGPFFVSFLVEGALVMVLTAFHFEASSLTRSFSVFFEGPSVRCYFNSFSSASKASSFFPTVITASNQSWSSPYSGNWDNRWHMVWVSCLLIACCRGIHP